MSAWDQPDADPTADIAELARASRENWYPRRAKIVLPPRMYDRLVAKRGQEHVTAQGFVRAEESA